MEEFVRQEGQLYLDRLRRFSDLPRGLACGEEALLLPDGVSLRLEADSCVRTGGLSPQLDQKKKDLLRVVWVQDALAMRYEETNLLSPSVYVHSLGQKPWHITTQGFLVTRLHEETRRLLLEEAERTLAQYGKHPLDSLWLPCSKPLKETSADDLVCVFNRRTGGWDGSVERPVIELLGAGGHLQSVWDMARGRFVSRAPEENLRKELGEELGMSVREKDAIPAGGFLNEKTQELVLLFCLFVAEDRLLPLQRYALGNLSENTDGLYLGTFRETMAYYLRRPAFFAGGEDAAPTNFPHNAPIMKRLAQLFGVNES